MNSFVYYLLTAAPLLQTTDSTTTTSNTPFGSFGAIVPFIAIIAIFYFLIIRPQNKKQKETKKMLEALKKGDRVVTIGGIHGTIQSVKEQSQSVIIKVDDSTKIEFSRSAISSVSAVAKEDKSERDDEKSEIEAPEAEDEK